jgi:hypothetical protein
MSAGIVLNKKTNNFLIIKYSSCCYLFELIIVLSIFFISNEVM